jgi:hypothetical protein
MVYLLEKDQFEEDRQYKRLELLSDDASLDYRNTLAKKIRANT